MAAHRPNNKLSTGMLVLTAAKLMTVNKGTVSDTN
jgi:hypothetical protein